jgi:orotate phosphoribosyltransferase
MGARDRLIDELRAHALVIGEVVLTSGATAQYYVDAKRAVLRPGGFGALSELVAERARAWNATAVGGLTMGADAPACAALAGGAEVQAIDAVRSAGHEIVGVVAILDRLAGGAERIREAAAAPYEALATIDDVYPDRPDKD